jgi:membrane protein YqaA with SNARE-associated domain
MLQVKVWVLLIVFSVVGTVATLAYYYLGKEGYEAVLKRIPELKQEQWARVGSLYDRYGAILLFLSSIPVVGVLLTTVAGAVGIRVIVFFLWVLAGRLARNVVLLLLFNQALGFLAK